MKSKSIKIVLALIFILILLNIILFLLFYQVESTVTETNTALQPTNDFNFSSRPAIFNVEYKGADMEPRAGGGTIRVDYYDITNLENETFCMDYTVRLLEDEVPICGSIGTEQICLRTPVTRLRVWSTQCEDKIEDSPLNPDYRIEPFFKNIPIIDFKINDTYFLVNETKEVIITESLGKSLLRKILD